MTQTQFILIPGFWLGGWAWDAVTEQLTQAGHTATALTLPGLEEDADARPSGVTLDDQAAAIIEAADATASQRVLVVHSGATVPGMLALDQRADLFDHVIFTDTAPVVDGYAMNADLQADTLDIDEVWEQELADGSMRDLTDEQLAEFRRRAVPQPAGTVRTPVQLSNPARFEVPMTVICTAFPAADYRAYAEQGMNFLAGLLVHDNVTYVDLPTGHWPMWSRPAELAAAFVEAGAAQL